LISIEVAERVQEVSKVPYVCRFKINDETREIIVDNADSEQSAFMKSLSYIAREKQKPEFLGCEEIE